MITNGRKIIPVKGAPTPNHEADQTNQTDPGMAGHAFKRRDQINPCLFSDGPERIRKNGAVSTVSAEAPIVVPKSF